MVLALNPTSNDLLFRLIAEQAQKAMNDTVIAQSAAENAPEVSIGPDLIASDKV